MTMAIVVCVVCASVFIGLDHSFCFECIMGHIEAKQSHGLVAECPLCM